MLAGQSCAHYVIYSTMTSQTTLNIALTSLAAALTAFFTPATNGLIVAAGLPPVSGPVAAAAIALTTALALGPLNYSLKVQAS